MRIISVYNHKGGVGKTLTSVNLAAALGSKYKKTVLLLDLDPQGNATSTFGIKPDSLEQEKSLAFAIHAQEIKMSKPEYAERLQPPGLILSSLIIPIEMDSLYLAPGNHYLSNIPFRNSIKDKVSVLKELLADFTFDYAIIDNKDSDDELLRAALYASDGVIIPTIPHSYSFDGVCQTIATMEQFKADYLTGPDIYGVLLNCLRGKPDSKENEVFQNTRGYCGKKGINVFDAIIPYSKIAANSLRRNKSVINYLRGNPAEFAFTNVAKEILLLERKLIGRVENASSS